MGEYIGWARGLRYGAYWMIMIFQFNCSMRKDDDEDG